MFSSEIILKILDRGGSEMPDMILNIINEYVASVKKYLGHI